jgi:nuclear transport factor 2 (NTF2) superfamily protein
MASSPPLVPPFTAETAHLKVKIAQDLWNTKCVILLHPSIADMY